MRRKTIYRSAIAMTLVEMMVSCTVTTFVAAGIAGLVAIGGVVNNRVQNKVDNLNAARQVIERIGRSVRMARNIGDIYGNPADPAYTSSNNFPSPGNPLYYQGFLTPSGGWPWGSGPGNPIVLSGDTLVVQIPVFDSNGFPTRIAAGIGTPPATQTLDNVDTLVYKAMPDPDSPGEYRIELSAFAGVNATKGYGLNSKQLLVANPPQVILRGLIGPTDSWGNLALFQYIDKTDGSVHSAGEGTTNANLTGVLINFELKNDDTKQGAATVGIKSEVYMRNNALMTITLPPTSLTDN